MKWMLRSDGFLRPAHLAERRPWEAPQKHSRFGPKFSPALVTERFPAPVLR